MSSPLLRLCDSCIFYNADRGTCRAFPNGIPLSSEDYHFEVLPNQADDETIYQMDEDKYDLFDMYRRVHPDVKFPVFITYDVPDGPVMDGEIEDNG